MLLVFFYNQYVFPEHKLYRNSETNRFTLKGHFMIVSSDRQPKEMEKEQSHQDLTADDREETEA